MIIQPDTLEKLIGHNVDFCTGVIGYMHDRLNRTMADHDMDIIKILSQGETIPNYPDT